MTGITEKYLAEIKSDHSLQALNILFTDNGFSVAAHRNNRVGMSEHHGCIDDAINDALSRLIMNEEAVSFVRIVG